MEQGNQGGQPVKCGENRRGRPLLELRGIKKSFAGVAALSNVSEFDLFPGEIHAIIGENGAGKSTLVKVLAGAYVPDSGTITLDGRIFDRLTPQLARENGIAVVHQEFNLLPDLSIAENIFLGNLPASRLGFVHPGRYASEAAALLARLGSDLDPRRMVRELTVAGQQLVEVAKALAIDARIIIMDEPSTVLSTDELEVLYGVLRKLCKEDRGVIYISHRLGEVINLADRVTVLKDGMHISTCRTSETNEAELVRWMVGRPLVQMYPQRHASLGEPVLDVKNLTITGKILDVSLTLRQGEILGVAGLGGSGRTTLARSLIGLERVTSGEVILDGKRAPGSPRKCARVGLVMVPEDRKAHGLINGQSITRNLSLPSLQQLRRLQVVSTRQERNFATRLVGEFDIRPTRLSTKIQFLSGGNQQKVVLARWLACSPKVVVLDEPTRGVDVGAKTEIYDVIEKLSESGVGVLVASSDLPELLGICDRIIVMCEGRVAGEASRGDATEEGIVRLASGFSEERAPSVPDNARERNERSTGQ